MLPSPARLTLLALLFPFCRREQDEGFSYVSESDYDRIEVTLNFPMIPKPERV